MSERFESVPVPFVKIGNRRGLTDEQLCENPYLAYFVKSFASSFEYRPDTCVHVFIEPDDK